MKTFLHRSKGLFSFLFLLTSLFYFQMASACNTNSSFQLSGCDSVVSPSGKHIWRIHGIYQDTIPNNAGCDSFMTITVRVNVVNAQIMPSLGNTLMAYPDSAKYLWIRCGTSDSLSTSQKFYPPGVDHYQVIVDYEGCVDTSECVYWNLGSVGSLDEPLYSVYPNPADGFFMVQTEIPVTVILRSVNGQYLASYMSGTGVRIDTRQLEAGTYLIEISSILGRSTEKLVVIHE